MEEEIHDAAFVAALFDRCAPRYRAWSRLASFGVIPMWRTQVVDRLEGAQQMGRVAGGRLGPRPSSVPHVVDLMAGTGDLWPVLRRVFPAIRITAIDLSRGMHRQAMARLSHDHARHVTHLTADALDCPVPDGAADMVVCAFGLKTLSPAQQARLAGEIARILRPGGAFAVIEASDPRGRLIRPLYRFYLDRVLPAVERLLLGGSRDFAMIGTYTQVFGSCAGFARALEAEGLTLSLSRHLRGCATSVAGIRPIAPPPEAG